MLDQASGLSETGSVVLVGDFNAEPHMEEVRVDCTTYNTGTTPTSSLPSPHPFMPVGNPSLSIALPQPAIFLLYQFPFQPIFRSIDECMFLFFQIQMISKVGFTDALAEVGCSEPTWAARNPLTLGVLIEEDHR